MPAEPETAPNHAWSGALPELVAAPAEHLLARLIQFLPDSSAAQHHAWRQELDVLHQQAAKILEFAVPTGASGGHSAVLESMLPREAGRRPRPGQGCATRGDLPRQEPLEAEGEELL
jgi:hypothetical protein